MGDIFREIDEELRQERFEKLWKAYGKYVIAAAVALLLGVAGYQAWDRYRTSQSQSEGAQFSAAVALTDEGRAQDAAALFAALADNAGDGYAKLARFYQAALRAKAGDGAGAIALYDALAADDGLDRALRDAATLFAVMHGLDRAGADSKALSARLQPLIEGGGPFRYSATELAALLALKTGDKAKARGHLKRLVDEVDAPRNLRARAAQILAVIGG